MVTSFGKDINMDSSDFLKSLLEGLDHGPSGDDHDGRDDHDGDHPGPSGDVPISSYADERTIDIVRDQLKASRLWFNETQPGVFKCAGFRHGTGYSEVTVTVDDDEDEAWVFVDTHFRIPADKLADAKRLAIMIDSHLIVSGLCVTDDGRLVFDVPDPVLVKEGDDVDDAVGKALSTIHGEAFKFSMLLAGHDAWKLSRLD